MVTQIARELKTHAPFTAFGALTGIVLMGLCQALPYDLSYGAFYLLHPIHVLLSALVTAAMYRLHTCQRISGNCIQGRCNLWRLLVIGYVGSVGIATLSDSVIPYLGEVMLNLPRRAIHLGFIEKWWLVNPLAVLGVVLAAVRPTTRFPHAGHVLLSTWASLFHMIMAMGGIASGWRVYAVVVVFLFLAVWIPCCVSDIVFPLLLVKDRGGNREPLPEARLQRGAGGPETAGGDSPTPMPAGGSDPSSPGAGRS